MSQYVILSLILVIFVVWSFSVIIAATAKLKSNEVNKEDHRGKRRRDNNAFEAKKVFWLLLLLLAKSTTASSELIITAIEQSGRFNQSR